MPFQINPHVQTLNALLAIPNEQFLIPPYQRRYSWQKKQIYALFQDINSLSLNEQDNDGHFLGMLLLHSQAHGIFNKLEVVDGQQRLTTLTILLKSIQKAFIRLGQNERGDAVDNLIKSFNYNDGTRFNKLILGNQDSYDYEIIMGNGNLLEIKNHRLRDAMLFFDELIRNITDQNQLNDFWVKLMNTAVIIRLDVGNIKDAYKLFETINNRGLPLSATDIIKNLLFGHASKINDQQTLEIVKNLWTTTIENLDGINNNKPDIFFRRYFCSLLRRKITATRLIEEFKNYYFHNIEGAKLLGLFNDTIDSGITDDEDEEDVENFDEGFNFDVLDRNINTDNTISIVTFLSKIKNASSEYSKLYHGDNDDIRIRREIKSLNKIQCEPAYIFLIQFMNLDIENSLKIEVIKILSSLMLRRHICKRQTGETDQIFSSLVKVIDLIEDRELFIQTLKDSILDKDYYPSDDEFLQDLIKYEFKGKAENRARALLEHYNSSLGNGLNEVLLADANEVHLEHIIPQKITTRASLTEFGDWPTYLGENATIRHRNYVSRIGNLTLIAASINMSMSNNPFHKKRPSYSNSDIRMTRELADFNEFKFLQIDNRSLAIAESIITHWRID